MAVVWLLTGLWHGANWTFVLWGLWFLVLLLGERYVWGRWLDRLPAAVGHIYTMVAVVRPLAEMSFAPILKVRVASPFKT